jgi:hypothetical protein
MRGNIPRCGLTALILAAAGQAAFALEFGLDTTTGNIQIPWTQQTPITAATFPTTNYYLGGDAWLSEPLGDDASLRLSYERDPVLRNTAIAAVQFERGIARISVGPLFGFLNSDSSPFSAGLAASARLQWPGIAYVSLSSEGGTAISIFQSNSDPQAQTELAAGFYAPHAIVSGLVSAKRFNELDDSRQLVTDILTRYAMTVDIFKKNVPYTALLSIGYELRSKHYAASDTTDSLGAIVLGLDATAQIDSGLTLKGGLSTGAYVFGLDALQGRGPGNSAFMFSATLGVSINTAQIRLPPKRAASSEEPQAKDAQTETAPESNATPPEASPQAATPKAETAPSKEVAQPPEATATATQTEATPPEKNKPSFPRLALDAGAGLYYNDRIKLAGSFAMLGDLFNARGGAWGRVGYRITPKLGLGGEIGFDYFTFSLSGTTLNLFDAPIRVSLRYDLGKVGLEAFTGPFINGITGDSGTFVSYTDVDFGARIRFGGIYAEASYVVGLGSTAVSVAGVGSVASNYPRFGLGYALKFK